MPVKVLTCWHNSSVKILISLRVEALGTFKSGEFLPEIESAISNLKVGETTPVVKSRMGYHIVKLTGKKLTTDPKFEKAKEAIKARLLETSFKRQLKTSLQIKRDESFRTDQ